MPIKKQTNTKKQTYTRSSVKSSGVLKSKPRFNKKIAILLTVLIAGIGVYFLFFANAATNNCQEDSGVNICDVDMVGGGSDTILSITGEAQSLGAKGWGVYYGTDFRAPTAPFKGAVPVTRINNTKYTWHDWVTTSQKSQKEAKDGTKINEGIAFYAWENPGVAGTVPVYRLSRGGTASQSVFSTDKAWVDKILAQDANNPDGWKSGTVLPAIAFYAYPPGYAVAHTVNPYDCSIQVNFLSDRCKMQREALVTAVNSGAIPKGDTCPTTYDAYKKAPFPGQFSAECQKKWNAYAQDCTKQENFLSDNCKGPRETLAREMERQALEKERAAAVIEKSKTEKTSFAKSGSNSNIKVTGSSGNKFTPEQIRFFELVADFNSKVARCKGAGYPYPHYVSGTNCYTPSKDTNFRCFLKGQWAKGYSKSRGYYDWNVYDFSVDISTTGDAWNRCINERSNYNRLGSYKGYCLSSVLNVNKNIIIRKDNSCKKGGK